MKLIREYIEKPWGRTILPPIFDGPAGKRIGEVWFTSGVALRFLVKFIFTSEALSVQVHPNDEQAHARGLASGKAECWYIIDADSGSSVGLGLKREVTDAELRSAALDGSIQELMHWQAVRAGDFIVVPPGTVHAIGAGISLLEFQQNADVTYRLYDYGRPRELHLDDAVAVADKQVFEPSLVSHLAFGQPGTLLEGAWFRLAANDADLFAGQERWIIPMSGRVQSSGDEAGPGEVLHVAAGASVSYDAAWALTGASS